MSRNVKCDSCGKTYFHKSNNYAKEVGRHKVNCLGSVSIRSSVNFISVQNEMQPYVNNHIVIDTLRLENEEMVDLSSMKDLQSLFRVNETKSNEEERNPVEIYDQMYQDFMDDRDNDDEHPE